VSRHWSGPCRDLQHHRRQPGEHHGVPPAHGGAGGLPPPPLVALPDAPGRISPGLLAFLVESRRVDNRRMVEELGVVPRYARLEDGVAASLATMRVAPE